MTALDPKTPAVQPKATVALSQPNPTIGATQPRPPVALPKPPVVLRPTLPERQVLEPRAPRVATQPQPLPQINSLPTVVPVERRRILTERIYKVYYRESEDTPWMFSGRYTNLNDAWTDIETLQAQGYDAFGY